MGCLLEVSDQIRGGTLQCRACLCREHQQLPWARFAGSIPYGGFLDNGMRVCSTDAEGADPGSTRGNAGIPFRKSSRSRKTDYLRNRSVDSPVRSEDSVEVLCV